LNARSVFKNQPWRNKSGAGRGRDVDKDNHEGINQEQGEVEALIKTTKEEKIRSRERERRR
jgi:hypothetical protein